MSESFPARLCCFFALMAAMAPSSRAQDPPTQADLENIGAAIARVEAELRETGSQRSTVETALLEAEKNLAGTNEQIREITLRMALEQERLAALQRQEDDLRALERQQRAAVAAYLRGAWRAGQEEYLKLLLNQQDPARVARSLRYYQYFSQARAEKIGDYHATLEELEKVRADIAAAARRLAEQRARLTARRRELEAGMEQRQRLLDELDRVLAESGARLERLRREREEMALLIEELNRSLRNLSLGESGRPFAGMRGSLPWPSPGPLLNRYGARHELGDLNWQGVTIAAEPGEEVRAIHHGRVVFADWFANAGLLLIIDHGDGYMSLYAHNQLLYKEVGDWVEGGETVAAAGNTGGREEPGVYFEIRHNGQSLDPAAWCVARSD